MWKSAQRGTRPMMKASIDPPEKVPARGVFDAHTKLNLRYSQLAPITMWEECNTGNNLPAQIEVYATGGDEYRFLFMAKGGGSANKSYF